MGPLLHLLLPLDLPIDLVWYGLYYGILGRDCAQVRCPGDARLLFFGFFTLLAVGRPQHRTSSLARSWSHAQRPVSIWVCHAQRALRNPTPLISLPQVATENLSSRLGMEGRQLVSRVNNCGLCGHELCDELVPATGPGADAEATPTPQSERTRQLACKHCFHDLCIRGWTMVGKKVRRDAARTLGAHSEQAVREPRWSGLVLQQVPRCAAACLRAWGHLGRACSDRLGSSRKAAARREAHVCCAVPSRRIRARNAAKRWTCARCWRTGRGRPTTSPGALQRVTAMATPASVA
jgi:hypothetical protein